VVTHGGFMAAVHRVVMQREQQGMTHNCSICEVISDGSTMAVMSWNHTSGETREEEAFGGGNFG
jgi:hypothetical protein